MIDKTIEELSLTEGGKAAIRIKKHDKVVKISGMILITVCFISMIAALSYDNLSLYYLCALIMCAAGLSAKQFYTRIHNIINRDCDPCKAEEAYTYVYLKYVSKIEDRRPSLKWGYYIMIARSVIFQGDYERAYSILSRINTEQLNKLNKYWLCTYYDVMRMYYCMKKDVSVLTDMKKFFFRLSKDSGLRKRYRKYMEKEVDEINLQISLEKGNLSDYNELSRKKNWNKGSRINRVSHRWADARAHRIRNDLEAARSDCQYIIENGNRLYYVDLAKKMAEEIGD